jgi:hypothetical protein
MSKRHQSSRRRAYGRRQHELHERFDRRQSVDQTVFRNDDSDAATAVDALSFLDPRVPRLRFAVGD